jgi:flagellar motor switch protein FliM
MKSPRVKKIVRPFDFAKIDKLTRQQLDMTEALLTHYPQLAESRKIADSFLHSLAADFNVPLELQYVGMEESTYGKFVGSFPSPCVAVQLLAEPQEARIILEVDYGLSRRLVDRLLGGSGSFPQDLRAFSPVEEGVLEFLVLKALSEMGDSSGILGPVSLKILKMVNEAKMLGEAASQEELGCVFKFYLGLGDKGGYFKVYFPHPLVEGLFLREDILAGVISPDQEQLFEERLGRVSHIKTSLWSEIGRVNLMASEKSQLERDDVILFDETLASYGSHGLSGKAVLRVGDNPVDGLLAEVIDSEGKMVLKVLDFYGGGS